MICVLLKNKIKIYPKNIVYSFNTSPFHCCKKFIAISNFIDLPTISTAVNIHSAALLILLLSSNRSTDRLPHTSITLLQLLMMPARAAHRTGYSYSTQLHSWSPNCNSTFLHFLFLSVSPNAPVNKITGRATLIANKPFTWTNVYYELLHDAFLQGLRSVCTLFLQLRLGALWVPIHSRMRRFSVVQATVACVRSLPRNGLMRLEHDAWKFLLPILYVCSSHASAKQRRSAYARVTVCEAKETNKQKRRGQTPPLLRLVQSSSGG